MVVWRAGGGRGAGIAFAPQCEVLLLGLGGRPWALIITATKLPRWRKYTLSSRASPYLNIFTVTTASLSNSHYTQPQHFLAPHSHFFPFAIFERMLKLFLSRR